MTFSEALADGYLVTTRGSRWLHMVKHTHRDGQPVTLHVTVKRDGTL